MTIQLPGFDPGYIFRILSDFWDGYRERDQLSAFWGGANQTIDDMYLQNYQADFSKSLSTVPVYWRYTWSNFQFDQWIDNKVFHRHLWVERTTVGGTTSIDLNSFFTPPETAGVVSSFRALLEGVVLHENTDYRISDTVVTFNEGLPGGKNLVLQWVDDNKSVPYHFHRKFTETLAGVKSSWTDAIGDAFDPSEQGPYQFNDPLAPIEIWVNGVRETNDRYVEPNSVLFQLNVVTPPTIGDWIVLKWLRTSEHPNPHVHYKYNGVVAAVAQNLFPLPFSVNLDTAEVCLNGVLQIAEVDYSFERKNLLKMSKALVQEDLLEVTFYRKEYRWKHAIDTAIVSAPKLQDGIDKPNTISTQGETHAIGQGWLYCDYNFEDVWAPNLWVDEGTVAKNFGNPIDFSRPQSNAPYLYSARGMWYVYWHGPSVNDIKLGGKFLTNLPTSPVETTVIKVLTDDEGNSTIQLAANNLVFNINPPLYPIVSAGQRVSAFQDLSSGVTVWDYINNPDWWRDVPGLHSMWGRFSLSQEGWVGFFDDRGTFDDKGFFDDAGEDELTDYKVFQLIKYFVWVLIIDSTLAKVASDTEDLTRFAETIKPTYTEYLAFIEHKNTGSIELHDEIEFILVKVSDVVLSPSTIPADGVSTSTATATVEPIGRVITWSFDGDALNCTINPATGEIIAGMISGSVIVRATDEESEASDVGILYLT